MHLSCDLKSTDLLNRGAPNYLAQSQKRLSTKTTPDINRTQSIRRGEVDPQTQGCKILQF
jgi:hypothetical protein